MRSRVEPDALFQGLDGTQLSVDGLDWRLEVFGVIDEPRHRWIQIALLGAPRRIVTVRVDQTQGPRHVARQLCCWLQDPSATRDVIQRVA